MHLIKRIGGLVWILSAFVSCTGSAATGCSWRMLAQVGARGELMRHRAVPGSVLYLVRSFGGQDANYTRLHSVMKTWGTTMVNRLFLVVGDRAADDLRVHAATQCEGTGGDDSRPPLSGCVWSSFGSEVSRQLVVGLHGWRRPLRRTPEC